MNHRALVASRDLLENFHETPGVFPWRMGQGELGFYTNSEIGVAQNVTRASRFLCNPRVYAWPFIYSSFTLNAAFHAANREFVHFARKISFS